MRWHQGVGTVVGLELRQRVRSKRWLIALVAWFVLVGTFTVLTLLSAKNDGMPIPDAYCDHRLLVVSQGEGVPADVTVDGCQLPADSDGSVTVVPDTPDNTIVGRQVVCTTGADGVVGCAVVAWYTMNGTTCYDIGDGPACLQQDLNGTGKPVPTTGPPPPDLGLECTSTADGSAVCHLPALTNTDKTMAQPPQTCTVRPDRTASCVWDAVDGWTPSSGPMLFGFVVFFVLGLGMLITPALTAGSVNGDRQAGTLATLQATTLSATQIALGKLTAAWLTMLAFLVAALPWLGTAVVVGGISWLQLFGCCTVLMLELAVMCAVGLGWSALVSRTSGSNLLSYLTVVTLSVLTVVFLALLVPLTTRDTQVQVWRLPADVQARWDAEMRAYYSDPEATVAPRAPLGECTWVTETRSETRTEETWWLLVPNPFVMVADAAPEPAIARTQRAMYQTWGQDPLFFVRDAVAQLAAGPDRQVDECFDSYGADPYAPTPPSPVETRDLAQVRVWPWSLAANLLLGGAFFAVAVRRLRVPYVTLPKGTRVA